MKHRLALLGILLLLTMTLTAGSPAYKLIETSTGRVVDLQEMVRTLKDEDVVFFGEFHDDSLLHALEYRFLVEFHKANPYLAVSLEMFERDTKPVLTAYLRRLIDEETFLGKSDPWPNYATDYRPLIEYARQETLDVVAANVPRLYASRVAREGLSWIGALPWNERRLLARETNAPGDEYKERFYRTMRETMGGMNRHFEGDDMLQRLYEAQCLKDDTMAESIVTHLQRNPGIKVVHFCGDFHSNAGLGTVSRVIQRKPALKVAVISPVYVPENEAYSLAELPLNNGDYLILLDRNAEDATSSGQN